MPNPKRGTAPMLNAAALVDENAVYGLLHVYVYSFKEK
jgi:hypothetical protein